jgi:hypothetical protein
MTSFALFVHSHWGKSIYPKFVDFQNVYLCEKTWSERTLIPKLLLLISQNHNIPSFPSYVGTYIHAYVCTDFKPGVCEPGSSVSKAHAMTTPTRVQIKKVLKAITYMHAYIHGYKFFLPGLDPSTPAIRPPVVLEPPALPVPSATPSAGARRASFQSQTPLQAADQVPTYLHMFAYVYIHTYIHIYKCLM